MKKDKALNLKKPLLSFTISRPMRILAYELMKEELWKQEVNSVFVVSCL